MSAETPKTADPPLAGIRVLDFTQNLPGPYATMVLAAMGAEVIKIEPPRGDTGRLLGSMFTLVNAGKKSIVLDLKSPTGKADLARLLPTADVLIEGFRPGVMDNLGAGPARAHCVNPRLVYCSVSAYGQTGPYRDYPGHDLNLQALTGVCHTMRSADGRPWGSALPIADLSSGITAVASILAALYARERDGEGRTLDVALADTVLSWTYLWEEGLAPSDGRLSGALRPLKTWVDASTKPNSPLSGVLRGVSGLLGAPATTKAVDALGERLKGTHRWQQLVRLRLHALPHYALYETRDGRWISVGIVDEHKFWRALCEGIELPRAARIPLSAIPLGGRLLASNPVRRVIAQAFRRRTLDQWLEVLDRARIPVAPVLPVRDAARDPQLITRIRDNDHLPRAPFPLAWTELGAAPELGQHTAELLGAANG